MRENPWSREFFDVDGQKEIVQTGSDKDVYGYLIDAHWPPHEAHSFIMYIHHARELAERRDAMEKSPMFSEDAQKRYRDGERLAEEALKRIAEQEARDGAPISRITPSLILRNIAIFLAVVYIAGLLAV